ncbi:TPA: helix-turn-helix domain-containing protein [Enterococcus faecalis]|uniref:helix-turn-helix domain-containing protein n=1 Tax=Enterococcus faecalis TaxID=1351 RepID=UPI0005E764AF|nr:helix-turn-helix domain-containing protein [Enterococcus faecalis]CPW51308.1 Helix-turn-helix [Mycobacteroides abscessus]EKZ0076294.1 helix-turn-helix domain-containing protein [Enterococcus faecalis]MBJ0351031.1 helix-turn-helix domain-containing protein [Enterococcus faecalis]MBJ0750237.1 helix-turn-helix domain-containing protein [Enterococcus faecalis]MBJ1696645.1 helix-turn-helix domain-containing protein [Enterococcus faecalis]
MFELDLEMIAKLRERRARKNITLEKASQEIGISRRTLGQIENEKILSVRKTVYKKLVDWLVNEKIYKEA